MATTKWWICAACDFWNHPRLGQDITHCEQCGGLQEKGQDYDPQLTRRT